MRPAAPRASAARLPSAPSDLERENARADEIIPRERAERTAALLVGGGVAAAVAVVVAEARLGPRSGAVDPTSWGQILAPFPPSAAQRGWLAGTSALGVLVLGLCWAYLAKLAADGRIAERTARIGWLAWSLPFAVGPPLMSRDVYAYAAQGELARHGLDPASVGVDRLGPGPFLAAVDPRWRETHAPYGGGATLLERAAATLGGDHALVVLVLLRLLAVAAVAALVLLARRLAAPRWQPTVVVLVGLNPIVLIDLVGGAHLDAVAAALLLGALVAARQPGTDTARGWGGPVGWAPVVLATLAGTVKATAFLGLAWLLVDGWRRYGRRAACRQAGIALVTITVVTLATGHGPTWLRALSTPGKLTTDVAPAALLAHLLSVGPAPYHVLLPICRALTLAVAGVIVLVLLARAGEPRDLRVVGIGSLAVALLSPVLYPWYLVPAVPLLAPLGHRWRVTVVVLSIPLAMATLPTLKPTWDLLGPAGIAAVATAGAAGLAVAAATLLRRPAPVPR